MKRQIWISHKATFMLCRSYIFCSTMFIFKLSVPITTLTYVLMDNFSHCYYNAYIKMVNNPTVVWLKKSSVYCLVVAGSWCQSDFLYWFIYFQLLWQIIPFPSSFFHSQGKRIIWNKEIVSLKIKTPQMLIKTYNV